VIPTELKIIEEPASRLLTTETRVRGDLQIGDDVSEELLNRQIEVASDLIGEFICNADDDSGVATIAQADYEERFDLVAGGRDLVLTRLPVVELISVADGSLNFVEATVDDAPNPAFGYMVKHGSGIVRKKNSADLHRFCGPYVVVRYRAGWTVGNDGNLPAHIEDACVLLIRRMIDRLQQTNVGAIKSESITGIGAWTYAVEAITWDEGLPSDVSSILKRYRRLRIG